jgi:Protein of unknown function (DUF3828)
MPAPTAGRTVPSRRWALAAICALPTAAAAQTTATRDSKPTPEAFLRGIYTPYPNHDFKGQPFWQVDRFFAPDLARAIEADMREAKRRGEAPKLDGDPFVDSQDWDIAKLSISVKADGPRAVGFVSFENLGKPTQIQLELVRTSAGWRITDIEAPSGKLSDLYK